MIEKTTTEDFSKVVAFSINHRFLLYTLHNISDNYIYTGCHKKDSAS